MVTQDFAHVAIDGPVGSGKTTVARALARRLDLLYLDTGALYRAVAVLTMRAAIDPSDAERVAEVIRAHPLHVRLDERSEGGFRIVADGQVFGPELYGNDVSPIAAQVAAHAVVREELTERQREIARTGAVVMAGRDIGTIVLPEARYKIYLTASVDARAERRRAELAAHGVTISLAELREQLIARDDADAHRRVAPLRIAEGAYILDSSELAVEEVVERIAALVAAHTPA